MAASRSFAGPIILGKRRAQQPAPALSEAPSRRISASDRGAARLRRLSVAAAAGSAAAGGVGRRRRRRPKRLVSARRRTPRPRDGECSAGRVAAAPARSRSLRRPAGLPVTQQVLASPEAGRSRPAACGRQSVRTRGQSRSEPSALERIRCSVDRRARPRKACDLAARGQNCGRSSATSAAMTIAAAIAATSERAATALEEAARPSALRRPAISSSSVSHRFLGGGARRAPGGGEEVVVDGRLRASDAAVAPGRRPRRRRAARPALASARHELRVRARRAGQRGAERRIGARLEREVAGLVALLGFGREGFGASAGRALQKLARGQAAEQARPAADRSRSRPRPARRLRLGAAATSAPPASRSGGARPFAPAAAPSAGVGVALKESHALDDGFERVLHRVDRIARLPLGRLGRALQHRDVVGKARARPATDSIFAPAASISSAATSSERRVSSRRCSIVFRLASICASASRLWLGSSRPGDPLDLSVEVGGGRRRILRQPLEPLDERAHQLAEVRLASAWPGSERSSRRSATISERRSVKSSCVRSSPPAVKTRPISSSFRSKLREADPRRPRRPRSRRSSSPAGRNARPEPTISSSLLLEPVEALLGKARIAASTRSNRSFRRAGSMLLPFRSSRRLTMPSICVCSARGSGARCFDQRPANAAPRSRRARSASGSSCRRDRCSACSASCSPSCSSRRLEASSMSRRAPARPARRSLGERVDLLSVRLSRRLRPRLPSCSSIAVGECAKPRSSRPSVSPVAMPVLGHLRGEAGDRAPRSPKGPACVRSRRRP